MNDFSDDFERPDGGEGLRWRDKRGDKKRPPDSVMGTVVGLVILAILIAWAAADPKPTGYDHTVWCVAPATNCG